MRFWQLSTRYFIPMSREQCLRWIETKGYSVQRFARETKMTKFTASRILNGRRLPTLYQATNIERLTGIRAAGWTA